MKDIKNVELFLFDLDGTVYIGDDEIEGSFNAINELRALGKKVCFFTNNSSRKHVDYIERLCKLGLKVTVDEVYTSGQATCEYLVDNYPGKKVLLLGNERLQSEFQDYGIELTDENPDIAVIAFDTSLTYQKLWHFCYYVQDQSIPYFATHPDSNCPAVGCPMPDVGALAEVVSLTVGRSPDLVMGKPFAEAGERIAKRFGLKPNQIAMVGDRLYTDIAFGLNCDFVSILVLSGETDLVMANASDIKADIILEAVRDLPELIKHT